MEDSSGMTIEFLRARLLSERSVSRSARQRADELEKMVCLKLQECLECSSSNLVLKELSLSLSLSSQHYLLLLISVVFLYNLGRRTGGTA